MSKTLFALSINEISLVKNPAVRKAKILISKSSGSNNQLNFSKAVNIIKSSDAEKKVYGYALVPDEVDEQGYKISQEEIRKAVDQYNRNLALSFQKGTGTGYEHKQFDDTIGYPILNTYDETGEIAKAFGIPPNEVIKGAWLTATQLTDKGWEMYQKGEFTGWSIGGIGYEGVVEKSITSQSLPKWLSQFFKKMRALLDEEVGNLDEWIKDFIAKNTISTIISETQYQVYSSMKDEETEDALGFEWSDKKKEDLLEVNKKKTGFFKKLFKSKDKEDNTLNKEEIAKMIDEAIDSKLTPIANSINTLTETMKSMNTKAETPQPKVEEKSQQTQPSEIDELKAIIKQQSSSFEALSNKVDEVLKSKPQSTQLSREEKVVEDLKKGIF